MVHSCTSPGCSDLLQEVLVAIRVAVPYRCAVFPSWLVQRASCCPPGVFILQSSVNVTAASQPQPYVTRISTQNYRLPVGGRNVAHECSVICCHQAQPG